MNNSKNRIGIYIHIPFCASKCAYCDFNSKAGCDKLMPRISRRCSPTSGRWKSSWPNTT
jgi:hypothetical protein